MTHSYGILEDQCQYSKVYCLTETGNKRSGGGGKHTSATAICDLFFF